MNVYITNLGAVAVPVSSSQGKGFASMIEPGESFTLVADDVTVANVGDNPSAAEEFTEGVKNLLESLKQLVLFWRERQDAHSTEPNGNVSIAILNRGTNALRVLLGSNMNEVQVQPGSEYRATAPEYVEIRELGV